MKILVVLGGAILSHQGMVDSFKTAIPKVLLGHEVLVATPSEALNGYFDLAPESIIFAGLRGLKEGAGNTTELVRSILIASIGGDCKKYILAAPLVVDLPKWREMFGVEVGDTNPDNLFRLDNWEGMKSWFGIS